MSDVAHEEIPMRWLLLVAALLLLAIPSTARANCGHHIGHIGGGTGSSSGSTTDWDSECIRWERVLPDGGSEPSTADAGTGPTDGGTVGWICAERASYTEVRGCGCNGTTAGAMASSLLLLALLAGRKVRR
jgi:hypothetical protein